MGTAVRQQELLLLRQRQPGARLFACWPPFPAATAAAAPAGHNKAARSRPQHPSPLCCTARLPAEDDDPDEVITRSKTAPASLPTTGKSVGVDATAGPSAAAPDAAAARSKSAVLPPSTCDRV